MICAEVPKGDQSDSVPSSGYGDLPVISEALLKQTAGLDPAEMIKVIIHLKYQPQDLISLQVSERYAAEMGELRQQIRAINAGYSNNRNLEAIKDADNYLDPALVVSEEDKGALREISEAHEALSLVIRDKIAEQLRQEVEADQVSVRTALQRLGGTVEFGMIAANTLVATVPVSALQKIAAIDKVARVSENGKDAALLTNADDATRVNASGGLMSSSGPTANGRRKPDLAAPGTDIDSCNNEWETELDYIEHSGTSMAAPMVQGVAMDLMAAGVLDELQIKALLINTAQKNETAINFESDAEHTRPGRRRRWRPCPRTSVAGIQLFRFVQARGDRGACRGSTRKRWPLCRRLFW